MCFRKRKNIRSISLVKHKTKSVEYPMRIETKTQQQVLFLFF